MSKGLDPEQACNFVRPYLGPKLPFESNANRRKKIATCKGNDESDAFSNQTGCQKHEFLNINICYI